MLGAPTLEQALTAALREQPEAVVVDLDNVSFFGSVGLAALATAQRQASERTRLVVVAPSHESSRPLRATGLDQEVPVYASRAQAFASRAE